MDQQTIKKLWVCKIKDKDHIHTCSLAYRKSESIKLFLAGTNWTWKQFAKQWGWTCVKVDVTFHFKP